MPTLNSVAEKLFFKSEREMATFSGKQKLKEFVASRPDLQETLSSLERTKMIQVRNLGLHKERKTIKGGKTGGKIKISIFLILK